MKKVFVLALCVLCAVACAACSYMGKTVGVAGAKIGRQMDSFEAGYKEGRTEEQKREEKVQAEKKRRLEEQREAQRQAEKNRKIEEERQTAAYHRRLEMERQAAAK